MACRAHYLRRRNGRCSVSRAHPRPTRRASSRVVRSSFDRTAPKIPRPGRRRNRQRWPSCFQCGLVQRNLRPWDDAAKTHRPAWLILFDCAYHHRYVACAMKGAIVAVVVLTGYAWVSWRRPFHRALHFLVAIPVWRSFSSSFYWADCREVRRGYYQRKAGNATISTVAPWIVLLTAAIVLGKPLDCSSVVVRPAC